MEYARLDAVAAAGRPAAETVFREIIVVIPAAYAGSACGKAEGHHCGALRSGPVSPEQIDGSVVLGPAVVGAHIIPHFLYRIPAVESAESLLRIVLVPVVGSEQVCNLFPFPGVVELVVEARIDGEGVAELLHDVGLGTELGVPCQIVRHYVHSPAAVGVRGHITVEGDGGVPVYLSGIRAALRGEERGDALACTLRVKASS